jgi:hypothetical protein
MLMHEKKVAAGFRDELSSSEKFEDGGNELDVATLGDFPLREGEPLDGVTEVLCINSWMHKE